MQELGEYLRRVREAKELSLNDIQDITKIRYSYLEAIESGNLEVIPGEVYQKGFIVSYANALGLESQEILEKYHQQKNKAIKEKTAATDTSGQDFNKNSKAKTKINSAMEQPGLFKSAKLPNPKKGSSLLQNPLWLPQYDPNVKLIGILVGLGLVVVIIFGLIFWQSSAQTNQTIQTNNHPTLQMPLSPSPVPLVTPTVSASSERNLAAHEADGKYVKQIFPAPVTVYIEFKGQVSLQVTTDGRELFVGDGGEQFDEKAPPLMLTAQEEMVMQISDPALVDLTLNGNKISSFGAPGNSCTVFLTEKGLKVAP